ncbi:Krr1-domain-containing protein [Ceratobasidium sp. AG-I]|nr:Krr1-domain-containing protein [Ceratobasidium sp. AG-I]
MLSEDESDVSNNEEIHQFTINEHYAKAFEYRKEREELAKLKEKYGPDFEQEEEGEDSESDESEDEYGEELTPTVDAALLRTLAKIRRKDPEIYDSSVGVFTEEAKRTQGKNLALGRPARDKSKPLTIKQQNLAALLDDSSPSTSSVPAPLTHAQEQAALRDETISAFHSAVKGEDDEDGLLTLREGVRDEGELREEEYKEFLQREVGEDLSGLMWVEEANVKVEDENGKEQGGSSIATNGKGKSESKKKGTRKERKEETDQEFLMNYILNRGWIDKSEQRPPTYREVVGPEPKPDVKGKAEAPEVVGDTDNGLLDEDEFDEVADRFESTYNFRFEEPDAHIIATHPRNISTVRRTDTVRKDAREKKKERKAEKMLAKREEVKRLKSLKMREIREKLEKVREEGGLGKPKQSEGKGKQKAEDGEDDEDWEDADWGALGELDLEGDWDPEKHDAQMRTLYAEGGEYEDEDQKPSWNDDIDIGDIEPTMSTPAAGSSTEPGKKKKKKRKHDEGDGVENGVDPDEMDAEVEQPTTFEDEEEWDGTEEMRKRKLEEYMEEIYGLDFNDMVGDMPTHFRYARVESSTHGLTPVEILMANDAELNSYVGLKRLAPYRKDRFDPRRPEKLKEFRKSLAARGVSTWGEAENDGEDKMKKRKGKKERQKEKAKAAMDEAIKEESGVKEEPSGEEQTKKKRKRKHGASGTVAASS